MTTEESNTIEAMRVFGGSFIRNLRMAYIAADDDNRSKIREMWPREWRQYTEQGRMLAARQEEETLIDFPAVTP